MPSQTGHPAVILLAVDDPGDVVMITDAFAQAAASVQLHVVSDGEQAIDYVCGNGPCLRGHRHRPHDPQLHEPRRCPRAHITQWIKRIKRIKRPPAGLMTDLWSAQPRQRAQRRSTASADSTSRSALDAAAAGIDVDPADRESGGRLRALRLRALVEATAAEVMHRVGRAGGRPAEP